MKNKGSRRRPNKAAAPRKGEAASDGAGGDRLSKLPDDILLNILERVDTLDALRTCILSKRMLKLPTMLSRFDIDVGNLARHHDAASYGYTLNHVIQYNNAVAGVAEKILSARNLEIPIRKLRLRFYVGRDGCLSISKAFACTMATQRVDNAEFVLLTEKSCLKCTHDNLLYYAQQFNNCLGDYPAAFAGLTHLWLRNMRFGELDIPNVLSTCKRLVSLRLSNCDAGVRSVLHIEHAQLVELCIEEGKFEAVQLNGLPKLQHVNFVGWCCPDPLTFRSVPQLRKLRLEQIGISSTKNLQLSQFLANVPWISDLHLDFRSEKIWVLPESPKLLAPVLGKLQIVNLDNLPEGCDMAWTMFILEAAPSLRELCITVWDDWCKIVTDKEFRRKNGYCEKANVEWQPSDFDLKHKNLVKLTIHGFQPDVIFVRYVRRILEVAVNMGDISLHDRKVCERCMDLDPEIKVCPSRYPRTTEEKDMLKVEITKELGMASHAVIHFRS
ncbi:uncharacterized protein LOC100828627 [Brachypodium distachyon]|uniref:F-box domain-containing protein n=1 Tax=Brachypodium distachyon TaxID=15368 RepID=I1H5C6_BRADI|nr:uncharacterized protein LOC100828627 [Brachypodium distachyon]KQK21638.1 hypothetical protein BRADI_1g62100v3 [Brachypodium distachyon]PNT77407.1 hypothetical protein BRADI_1g62100v3 [Brachypodium distachyon]|eukprot:XP_003557892.1 uncharacterized protein LOC100828627 [Brachypodium distachyon]